ncbi:glutamate racemase [Dethiobacter alkaliphilus]|uniref:glutamate racemase n=1 Tax=Dethiobacter alkaliphilus TaxID=427926 RepID=UPI002225CBFB|nr:glutamate racemase [Dethiobacter alkaliphilus]MCW3490071.1 glutamate racemase [Dethiobacter alkaliphilus]
MNKDVLADKPIGFFDSGAGGLTVLASAVKCLPNESFLYFGDTAHAPYGSRPVEDVRNLSVQAAEMLCRQGCKALVVACNTATSAAVHVLREMLPIPVIGMEPAVKPALAGGGKVLVMATPLTLKEEKFKALCDRCGADENNVIVLPCPGLVEMVERGETEGPAVERALAQLFAGADLTGVSAVVLGCTHYLFLRRALTGILPADVRFVDGNLGTVKQLARILKKEGLLREEKTSQTNVEILSSGGEASVRLFKELFQKALTEMEVYR